MGKNELGANEALDVLKAYVHVFNAQIYVTPKMDKFAKKCNFLSGVQKWVVDALFKFPKFPEDVVEN